MELQVATKELLDLAKTYRAEEGLKAGFVCIFNGKVSGWSANKERSVSGYLPGTWAVDESGNKWLAIGGNDYDGAKEWQMIPHDTFGNE